MNLDYKWIVEIWYCWFCMHVYQDNHNLNIYVVACLQDYTQYIPLSVYELESWFGTPLIYVFDRSTTGMIVNAFLEIGFTQ